jgi:hypothetical protein
MTVSLPAAGSQGEAAQEFTATADNTTVAKQHR